METLKQDVQSMLGISLTNRQMAALEKYEQELIAWNAQYNLTAIRDIKDIRTKHFLDSMTCILGFRDNPPQRLIDVGTGAGFPGIPLKIIMPGVQLTLVESVGKKAEFCRHMVELLGLERVEVIQNRAEELGQMTGYRERFQGAVARAVANLPVLVEYLLPLVMVGGVMLAQKGVNGPAEAHSAEKAAHFLGGRLRQLKQITLPGVADERYLVIIDKVAATPKQFPRRTGIPSKRPL